MSNNMRKIKSSLLSLLLSAMFAVTSLPANAQDVLPADNGFESYHTSPRYRESESHPLRVLAYIVHPIGWAMREFIFRPLSYFASSSETRRSIMGYREPYDYRQPWCFSADDSIPDCRSVQPFNYSNNSGGEDDTAALDTASAKQVYFPNVNFDFDKRTLNQLGRGRVQQIAAMVNESPNLKVVLQGHTDYKGSDKYNEKLGLDRAESVRQELIAQGVSADRLSTVTFGETQPVYSEDTDWARAVNRRVEVQPDAGVSAPAPIVPAE
jgi:outer membrane protein OmpA-like peptidoglycan-associated protein